MKTDDKTLTQEQIEEIVGGQIKSGMDWAGLIIFGILFLPMFLLSIGGIYAGLHIVAKLAIWLLLYITFYKCEKWVIERKVRHTVEKMWKVVTEE